MERSKTLAAVVASALMISALAAAGGDVVGASTPARRTVHLRGTAYEFNNYHLLLAGATIRVAEFPRLKAVVRANGTYDLVVPDRARVTPYIVAAGHHTIYLQTFTTAGENLANVNFQVPSAAAYLGLVALLKVPVDAHGNPVACAIVSTFSTRNVRDLSYAAFIAYGHGAHGVPGATATASPALPKPRYFNKDVLPDPSQAASSEDGGVVWTGVPAGVYTISGHRRGSRFASFVATCRRGRVVNANPPWGLHELAPANPARISATWAVHGSRVAVRSLTARKLPVGAIVRVSCAGRGCPFGSRKFIPGTASLDIRRAFGGRLRLRPGQELEIAVTAHAFNGTVVRWAVAAGHAPSRTTLCIPLGNSRPRRHC